MLEQNILEQVRSLFAALRSQFEIHATIDPSHAKAGEMRNFLTEFSACSDNIQLIETQAVDKSLQFSVNQSGKPTGITFSGIPGGHEFTSLLLLFLNADGIGKNLPDDAIRQRISALHRPINLHTYMSLSCTNCPDVVQSLNIIALLNPNVNHVIIDGELHQDDINKLGIQGVPSVYADGELLHVGRGDLGELLLKLEQKYGVDDVAKSQQVAEHEYDVVVIGGGPAGSSAAIYSARKGLKVAIVGERIGGQVRDTTGIENLISVPTTTGTQLAADLRAHIVRYDIDIYENRSVERVDLSGKSKRIVVHGGESFVAPAVIIATGASWRRLGVEGEAEHIGRGVAFCPHCDGPFYKGRHVAVIGGGNSGIEAAIDLSGICSRVTVLEFADTLRADAVLQEKAAQIANIEIFKSMQTTKVLGDGRHVSGLQVRDRHSGKERTIELDGVFLQIGLAPNSKPFGEALQLSARGEICIDEHCRTSVSGVYAAGDVTTVPYKQIIIAMGEGAKAALSAFDDKIRGVI